MNFHISPTINDVNYDVLLKVVIIGNSGTGKSCLLKRCASNTWDGTYITTIGVDFEIKSVRLGDKLVKLQIWDTAGQERFRGITTAYYRGAHIVLVVYDITSLESFRAVPKWIEEARSPGPAPVIMIVGNKLDLVTERENRRAVSTADLTELAKQQNCMFIETSARSAENVERAFCDAAQVALKNRLEPLTRKVVGTNVIGTNRRSIQRLSCCR